MEDEMRRLDPCRNAHATKDTSPDALRLGMPCLRHEFAMQDVVIEIVLIFIAFVRLLCIVVGECDMKRQI